MRNRLFVLLFLLGLGKGFAHYIWIETKPVGEMNKEHEVKIRFGEYTYGVVEEVKGDAFKGVSDFTIWIVDPNGKVLKLKPRAKDDYYQVSFIPKQEGAYTIALDNKEMKVLDYTQYDFGIFKPQYHAKAKVTVGKTTDQAKSNDNGIEIVDISSGPAKKGGEVTLKVLFKGAPLSKNEIVVYVADLWSKKMETNEEGEVSFKLPWETLYTVETTYNENVPGIFNGDEYEFIWHCATYGIQL